MEIDRLQSLGCGLALTVVTMTPAARPQDSRQEPPEVRFAGAQTDTAHGNVVDITARDFSFDSPESIPAGLTTFRLRQVGKFAHDMSILQLTQNKTYEAFAAVRASGELLTRGAWAKNLGGPGFIDPPHSTNTTLVLEPGFYVLVCFMTAPQDPPEHQRMSRPLHVVPAPGALSIEPPTDLVVKILDNGYEFSPTLSAGRHVLRVENAASQRRLFRMERVLPDRTVEEALSWSRGRLTVPETVRPTESKGRLAGFEPGQHLIMSVDLDPGTYLVSSSPSRATSQVFVVR
jgi:hypothetical protein